MTDRTADGTAYDIHGPDGAPTVILIHGLGLARGLWADHLTGLTAQARVVTYDLFGHGESAPTPEPASLTLFARQIAALMDHLGLDRVSLVGFSIGGMINRRFALDYADRLTALAILNSPHGRGEALQREVEARATRVRDEGPMATMDAALDRWFTSPYRSARPDVMAQVRAWRAEADPRSYAEAAWVLAHGVRELTRPPSPIGKPTLVMTCENDTGSTPAMSRAIAAEIPGADCRIVPELRHLGLLEAPNTFTSPLCAFLGETLS